MSELEPQRASPPPEDTQPSPPAPQDPWSVWIGRTSQLLGLGIMAFETASTRLFGPAEAGERPWLMLFATAMILGGVGLNILLRALVTRMAP